MTDKTNPLVTIPQESDFLRAWGLRKAISWQTSGLGKAISRGFLSLGKRFPAELFGQTGRFLGLVGSEFSMLR